MNRAMAFWKSDTYPFVLAGEIKEFKRDGLVSIQDSFNGYLFKPILILEYGQGLELKNELEKLKDEYRIEKTKLHESYVKKKEDLFKQYK